MPPARHLWQRLPVESFTNAAFVSQRHPVRAAEYRTMTAILAAEAMDAPLVHSNRGRAWRAAGAVGLVGFATVWIGSWVPSFWGDEAASVMSAERSLPSLVGMLGRVDAVHGAYYLFLHFWIALFGASELAVRLPSAIAVGFCVAGTFLIGRMLVGGRFGLLAAILCAVLPRTGYLGSEARSYAFATVAAVWITLLLLVLVRHRFATKRSAQLAWLGYAVAFAAGIYVFLYLGLLLLVHGTYLLATQRRAVRRPWVVAAGVTIALSLPIIALGYAERAQIQFLAHRHYATPKAVLVSQWFGNPFLATAGWLLILVAVTTAVIMWRHRRRSSPVVLVGVFWFALPTAALLVLNAMTPAYSVRYLSFCVPGVALALAAGLWAIRLKPVRLAAAIVLVALAIPTDIGQREPFAKDHGSDLAQASALVAAGARPGDGIVFDRTTVPRQRPRLALHLYPDAFRGLEDIALKTPYDQRAGLWDTTYAVNDVAPQLATLDRVWVLERKGSPDNLHESDIRSLESDGFSLASTQLVHRTVVYLLVRHP
jgi:mannosyltransferase